MLNFKQAMVVNRDESLLVIAGPGSGKTHTITEKIKEEVSKSPENINNYLLLTFTNAAANEILQRVKSKVPNIQDNKVFFGTYHSIFKKLMNTYGQFEKLGLGKTPTIIMPSEQQRLLNKYLKEEMLSNFKEEVIEVVKHKYDIDGKDTSKVTEKNFTLKMLNSIIDSKQIFRIMDSIVNQTTEQKVKSIKNIKDINKFFLVEFKKKLSSSTVINELYIAKGIPYKQKQFDKEELKKVIIDSIIKMLMKKDEQKLITFTDILFMSLVSLVNSSDFREKVQKRFTNIYIDEFQDTNIVQFEILKQIYNKDKHIICIIGDPYQSIYAFLGADISNILNVKTDLELFLMSLDINYRSNENIVDFTNHQIKHMKDKINQVPECFSGNKEVTNNDIEIHLGFNPYGDYRNNTQRQFMIKKLKEYQYEGKNIGIITRSGNDFKTEKILNDYRIDYVKRGGLNLKETKEIQVLSNLTMYLFSDVDKDISLEIILENTKGIGAKALENFVKDGKQSKSIKEVLNELNKIKNIDIISNAVIDMNKFYHKYIMPKISSTWKEDRIELAVERLEVILEEIEMKLTKEEVLEEVANLILDKTKEKEKDTDVVLTTIHSAKGLEWDVVFLMDWSPKSFEKDNEEEAKRLNYVAISRAKEHLYILSEDYATFANYDKTIPYIKENKY